MRKVKRRLLTVYRVLTGRPLPRIERSTIDYLAAHAPPSMAEIFPAESVRALAHPLKGRSEKIESSEPAYLFELNHIDFWCHYGGSVVTGDNCLLADLSPEVWGVENHPIFSRFHLPRARPLAGCTAICVTPETPGNYYHWIVDLLPRVALLKARRDFNDFAQILVNGSGATYEKASLMRLGVPLNKIFYVDARHRFRIDRAIIPSMDDSLKIIAPWKIRLLRELRDSIVTTDSRTAKRIYVSRGRAAVRRIVNERELRPILQQAGFAIVELESLPWEEQVQLFSNAEVVLAPHGAALANIVFCRPKTVVGEIGTRSGYLDFYLRLAASASLRNRFVEARPRVESSSSSRRSVENEDMILEEQQLQDFLRELT